MFKKLFVFLSLLPSVAWAGPGPTAPMIASSVQLGSERLWERIESTFQAKTSASIARRNFVSVFAVDAEGKLWQTNSANYTKPWTSVAGCRTQLDCLSTYAPSGKRRTEWNAWNQLVADSRFDFTVKPVVISAADSTTYVFLSQTLPEKRVVAFAFNDSGASGVKINVTPVLTARVTSISAAFLGNKRPGNSPTVLAVVHLDGSLFRLFEKFGTSAFGERRVVPAGTFQVSEAAPSLQTHGIENQYGTLFYKVGGTWTAQYFEHVPSAAATMLNKNEFRAISSDMAPQVVWQPGGYAHAVVSKNNRLNSMLGLINKQNIGLPAVSREFSPSLVREFKTFNHHSDVFVASIHSDGTTQLHRFGSEQVRGEFQPLANLVLSHTSDLRSLDVVQLGQEVYLTGVINTGRVLWVNIQRAAAEQMSQKYYLLHYAPPTMGLPYDSLLAFSNFGSAFWSVPLPFHELYKNQPSSRCHPTGFTPPIVCGKVFFEWNDYWGTPTAPGTWQTRDIALNTLRDADPTNDWPLGWLKAFVGSVILKSSFNDTQSIFHELMHEFDFDGINGTLVPGEETHSAEYATLFNNRAKDTSRTRVTGYVSGYAESNSAEDWADTASYYRFQGAWFRFLAALDTALGDNRLQQKYNFVKKVFSSKEFSNFGTLSFGSDSMVPVIQAIKGRDYITVASVHETNVRIRDGFTMNSIEGWAFSRPVEDTTPLKLFVHRTNGQLAAASSDGLARTLSSREYRDTGTILGYVYATRKPGTIPLKMFAKDPSGDVTLSANPAVQGVLRSGGYRELSVDSYILGEAAY